MEGKRICLCYSVFKTSDEEISTCSWIILRHSGITLYINPEKSTSKSQKLNSNLYYLFADKYVSREIEEVLPRYARENFFICFPSSEYFHFGGTFEWILDLLEPSDNLIPTPEHATALRIFKVLQIVTPSSKLSEYLLKTSEKEIKNFVSASFQLCSTGLLLDLRTRTNNVEQCCKKSI